MKDFRDQFAMQALDALIQGTLADAGGRLSLGQTKYQQLVADAYAMADHALIYSRGGQPRNAPRAIGSVWQGGVYAGLVLGLDDKTYHLVVNPEQYLDAADWAFATAWAGRLRAGGHKDWRLPTRREALVVNANVQPRPQPKVWRWLGEGTGMDDHCAWAERQVDGFMDTLNMDVQCSAYAVRTVEVA